MIEHWHYSYFVSLIIAGLGQDVKFHIQQPHQMLTFGRKGELCWQQFELILIFEKVQNWKECQVKDMNWYLENELVIIMYIEIKCYVSNKFETKITNHTLTIMYTLKILIGLISVHPW